MPALSGAYTAISKRKRPARKRVWPRETSSIHIANGGHVLHIITTAIFLSMIWHNTDFIAFIEITQKYLSCAWGCGLLEAYCISYGKAGKISWIVSRFYHSFTCTYCMNTSYIAWMFIYVLIIIIIILSMPLTPENQVQLAVWSGVYVCTCACNEWCNTYAYDCYGFYDESHDIQ